MRAKIAMLAVAFMPFAAAVCAGEPGDLSYVGCFEGAAERRFAIGFTIKEINRQACLTECAIFDGIMSANIKYEKDHPTVKNGQLTDAPFSGSFVSVSRFEGTYNSFMRYSPVKFVSERVLEKR